MDNKPSGKATKNMERLQIADFEIISETCPWDSLGHVLGFHHGWCIHLPEDDTVYAGHAKHRMWRGHMVVAIIKIMIIMTIMIIITMFIIDYFYQHTSTQLQ